MPHPSVSYIHRCEPNNVSVRRGVLHGTTDYLVHHMFLSELLLKMVMVTSVPQLLKSGKSCGVQTFGPHEGLRFLGGKNEHIFKSHIYVPSKLSFQINLLMLEKTQLDLGFFHTSSVALAVKLSFVEICKHIKWLFLQMALLKLDSCGSNPSLGSLRPATVISGRLKRYQITRSISIKFAQLVERRTRDSVTSMTRVRIPSGAQENFVTFSESKMLCSHVVGVTPLRGKAQIFFP